MRFRAWLLAFPLVLLVGGTAKAISVPFILDGNAGLGLLPGNENHAVTNGGSGGILGSIVYDTDTNILTVDIGWGSGNGFTDLSGNATAAHVHWGTASGPPAGFSQNANNLIFISGQPGYSNSATNGGFNGTLAFSGGADTTALLEGRTYINVHTSANPSGEIRGHLVVVPEPSSLLLVALGMAALALRRR